jgi:putative sterol carrier protein
MNAKEFLLSLPTRISPDVIEGMTANFHFDITGDSASQYTVAIGDGKVDVQPGLNGDASCKVTATADTLSGLLSKKLNPMTAVMMGKIKISNLGEMMKYAKILGLM